MLYNQLFSFIETHMLISILCKNIQIVIYYQGNILYVKIKYSLRELSSSSWIYAAE